MSCDVIVTAPSGKSCGSALGEGKVMGCWQLLCVAFSIVVIGCLLCCSGDVEMNPGPTFSLILDNLHKVRKLIWDASPDWFDLGLELRVNHTTLRAIKQDNRDVTKHCFNDMLSEWLKMVDPLPSWEGLITALMQPCVGHHQLAQDIKEEEFGRKSESRETLHRIQKESIKLQEKFGEIVDNAYDIICEKQVSVDQFTARLANLPLDHQELHREFIEEINAEIRKGATVLNIWLKLSSYWNFLNYFLLEQVVRKFGDEGLKSTLEDYKKQLKEFRCGTRLCDFAKYSILVSPYLSESKLKSLAMKLDQRWDKCTLEDLENLAGKFTHRLFFPSFALTLEDAQIGSIHVTWVVPARIGASLQEKLQKTDMKDFCNEHGIMSITINECKYSAIKKYSAYLKDLYSHKQRMNLVPFKLAKIKGNSVTRRQCDDFTRSTLRGDQDDILYAKVGMYEGVEQFVTGYPEMPFDKSLILIEGAAGVGKTTLSEQSCYKWSREQPLSIYRLLVLLPLRDNWVKSARNLSDLFPHPGQLQQAVAEEVMGTEGEGVALWLDGWDELANEERTSSSSIFYRLVHGHVLKNAAVIVTSRPWATYNLKVEKIKLYQHVEIVSTPSIHINRILRKNRVGPDSRAKFIDYVNLNPSIKAGMNTPLTADMFADVFQLSCDTESTPPTTMTELYTAFTCKLLMQHLSSQENKSWKVHSLEYVPANIKERLLEICRLAWEGIKKQQLVFSNCDEDTLGLMYRVRELHGGKIDLPSYHFIHLTIQEFLSAYYITKLEVHQQEQIIYESTAHLMVVRFYFGLTGHNNFTSRMIENNLFHGNALHWLFEAGEVNTVTEELGVGKAVRVEPSSFWSPLDCYFLGYSIAHYQFKWCFKLESMLDEEIEMFSKGIGSAKFPWRESVDGYISFTTIALSTMKWFSNIPLQTFRQIDRLMFFPADQLDFNAFDAFCELIPSLNKLQVLSLGGNPIGKGGAVKFLKHLYHSKAPLEVLDLGTTGVGETDCAELGPLIAKNNLKRLDIHGNNLSSNSVASIMEGLLRNIPVQTINMSDSNFSVMNCMSLATLLQQSMRHVASLEISNCGISSEGSLHLARALSHNHSLTDLNISGNPIRDIGAAAFGDMVNVNTTLEKLDMSSCEITSEGRTQLRSRLSSTDIDYTL